MAQHKQFGGTLSGFVLGLVIGLTIALGVAMYVTKVPMPFSNKNLSRSAEQDAAEAEKNKDWNPNSALQNKPAIAAPAEGAAASEPASSAASSATPSAAPGSASGPASASSSGITAAPTPIPAPSAATPAVSADPLADLAKAKQFAPASSSAAAPKAAASSDPFTYFVQTGAFKTPAEAEAQRVKLSLLGVESKVSERDQGGRAIYRVRSGPFDDKDLAEKIKARIDSNGLDTALVRVQR